MRLINADALKDGYMHMGYDPNEHPEESYMEGWCKGFNAAVDHCICHVIHAPTIEPERKPGKWILGGYDDMYYVCDQCGYRRSDYYAKPKAKYCENCGADMREGEVDDDSVV